MPPKSKTKSAASEVTGQAKITITEGDRTYRLRTDELGPGDDLVCRQQAGYPVGHFLETFSGDSMVVVIWMARRKSGEPNLAFQSVLAQYPTYADLDGLDADFEEIKKDKDGLDKDTPPLADEG